MLRSLWSRLTRYANDATITYKVHAWAMLTWALLVIPSWYLWRNDLFWVIFISLYANFATHWSSWQGVRAELAGLRAELEAARASALVDTQIQERLQRIEDALHEE